MIALFGGTFDPIHLGHMNMAHHCVEELKLDSLYFLPCAIPVHKAQPKITTEHRLAMMDLALGDNPFFKLDDRELKRQGPSYSLLTLQECRAEHPDTEIVFLMGMDSFNSLTTWYHWQSITQLCHIVVYQRPGERYRATAELDAYLNAAQVATPQALNTKKAGLCYFLTGPSFNAASSDIRKIIKNQQTVEQYLPDAVSDYIYQHQLYAD